jgi:serine/threonine protein kinase/tetratricopeptide (TPR) repeat protein
MAIFNEALDLDSPTDRAAYLDRACAGDPALRARVEELLAVHSRAGSFLESPVVPTIDPVPRGPDECPGGLIGPYKLLEKIGEGGMGEVWMAEQRAPMQRKVALKIIKAGMDTRQVVARFEAERQALALMDHPNIAKILDAGATDSGRPYFVMELVKGTPITTYCDQRRLTLRERLELFVPICQAIQHAHQKGIIHRDLKPSNVLIAPYDGRPVPKVIDFGVAKAIGRRLTERTLYTGFGAVIGTLEYMSPEQAELNNQDIDTRSDIYALGVLLYELLTGTTPLSHERVTQAAFTEMLRVIREEEPPKPSTRLSDSKETLPAIAEQRHTEPARLPKLVQGELDWIVMKALEKDRNRRYETASSLARDIESYLHDEPVLACPPSAGYRVKKFLRRNKGPVTAVAVVLLALVGGIVGTTWGMFRAQQARREADARAAETQAVLGIVGNRGPDIIENKAEAVKVHEQILIFRRATLGPDHPDTLRSMHQVAYDYWALGRHADALALCDETLTLRTAKPGPDHPLTLISRELKAKVLFDSGRREEGLKDYEETLALFRAKLGPDSTYTLDAMRNLATNNYVAGRAADGLKLFKEMRELTTAKYGRDHPKTFESAMGVARCLVALGRGAEALPLIDECLARATGRVAQTALSEMALLRLRHYARAKDAAGCRATAEMAEKLNPTDATCLYHVACMRAVTAAVIRARDKTETAARSAAAEADRAMAWLNQAVAAGYNDVQDIKSDKDLDVLRDRKDFQRLLADLEASKPKDTK